MSEGQTQRTFSGGTLELPPWESATLFQEKPRDGEFGYLVRGRAVPCSEQELVARVTQPGEETILVAWSPRSDRFQTIYEIPQLTAAAAARIAKAIRVRIGGSLFMLPFLAMIVWSVRNDPVQRGWWAGLLTVFALIPVLHGWWEMMRLRRDPPAMVAEEGSALRYGFWEGTTPLWLTQRGFWVLVGVFILQHIPGIEESVLRAGVGRDGIRSGEWLRLVSGTLLHGNILHIWFNVMAWRSIGRTIEALAGWPALSVVFLSSLVGGSVMSIAWRDTGYSVGASGGICGMIGFALVLGIRYREILPRGFARNIWWGIGYTLAMGLLASEVIDNGAHLGGLLTGVALALVWSPWSWPRLPLPGGPVRRAFGTGALMVLGAAVALTVFTMLRR